MKNKKKKAFTLVELLAVIVILAVILVIAIPQIMSVIKSARLSSIKDSAMLIAEQAEKDFLAQQVLNKDYNESSIPCGDVAKLNNDYDSCNITYNNGIATVKLKGKDGGKFSGITCKGTKDNMKCSESDGTILAANNEDAVEYLEQLLDTETTSTTCDGTGKLIEVTHENGDVDYRYVGACPNNYVTFNGEAPQISTVYMMYADGDISTNSPRVGYQGGNEFPDETTCINSGLNNGSFTSLGLESDIPAKCVLNITTNKWYIEAHGYLTGAGTYTNQTYCENAYSSQGMKTSTPAPGISCRSKQILSGGGWRIIGIFDTEKTLNGTKEKRIKLVRNDSLGNYSWDTSNLEVNGGYGVNEWSQADLKTELNGDYLNSSLSSNTIWYNGMNNQKTATFDKNKVLKSSAQELVDEVLWYTGGSYHNESLPIQYIKERSNVTCHNIRYNGCFYNNISDEVKRTTTWIGKVGLIYPSDYGYASANINCTSSYGTNNNQCREDNWIYRLGKSNISAFTISPGSIYSYVVGSIVNNGGAVANGKCSDASEIFPTVYLKSNILISGEGTVENPYVFSK